MPCRRPARPPAGRPPAPPPPLRATTARPGPASRPAPPPRPDRRAGRPGRSSPRPPPAPARRARRRSPVRGAGRHAPIPPSRYRPSTGTPTASQACRSTCSWRAEPTRLRMTPAIPHTAVSRVENPCSTAAMVWLWPRASTTSTTGAPSSVGHLRGGPGRRGDGRVVDAAVEQAHHALDHGDVGVPGAVPVQRADQSSPTRPVQVTARDARGQGVIAGVDEVGADLERRHPVTGLPQRADQTRCDRGLSAAGGRERR